MQQRHRQRRRVSSSLASLDREEGGATNNHEVTFDPALS